MDTDVGDLITKTTGHLRTSFSMVMSQNLNFRSVGKAKQFHLEPEKAPKKAEVWSSANSQLCYTAQTLGNSQTKTWSFMSRYIHYRSCLGWRNICKRWLLA